MAGPSAFHPETLLAEVARRPVGQEEPPAPESFPRPRRAVEAPVPRVAVCSAHVYGHRSTSPLEPLHRFFPARLRVKRERTLSLQRRAPTPLPSAQQSAPAESQGAASEDGGPFSDQAAVAASRASSTRLASAVSSISTARWTVLGLPLLPRSGSPETRPSPARDLHAALLARLDSQAAGSHRPPERTSVNPYWLAQASCKARWASWTALGESPKNMLATARLPGPNAEGCTEEDTTCPWQDCGAGSAAAGAAPTPTPIAPAASATTSFFIVLLRFGQVPAYHTRRTGV
jgi:hypothetical protein